MQPPVVIGELLCLAQLQMAQEGFCILACRCGHVRLAYSLPLADCTVKTSPAEKQFRTTKPATAHCQILDLA